MKRSWIHQLVFEPESPTVVRRRAVASSSRDRNCATLPLGRVGQARPNVILGQLREVSQQIALCHASGQVAENIPDRDPGPTHAGLTESNVGIDADPVQWTHM